MSANPDLTTLERGAAALGVPLDPEALARFAELRRLLLDWNRRVNLTRVTAPAEVEVKLMLDALALSPWIARVPVDGVRPKRLVDVGAGAGFPGLPLKIADPSLDLVLIEATGKKVQFIDAAIDALGLTGVRAIYGRAEELGHDPSLRGSFDIATARAVARLPALLELCLPFCRPGGLGLFPKGREANVEAEQAARALYTLQAELVMVEPVPLPELAGTSIVVVREVGRAPKQYPRRPGVPAKSPL